MEKKKPQTDKQNWSVILTAIPAESKSAVANSFREVFSVSSEEADKLVTQLPIILLENLYKSDAVAVRNYFYQHNAGMSITTDKSVKEKCYRAVWPRRPDFETMHRLSMERIEALSRDAALARAENKKLEITLNEGEKSAQALQARYDMVSEKVRALEQNLNQSQTQLDQTMQELEAWKKKAEELSAKFHSSEQC